eukprot:s1961_g6.t1
MKRSHPSPGEPEGDSCWSLFDDENQEEAEGVGGVCASEHPYFKGRTFPKESLEEALDEYIPTACDFLTMAGMQGRSTASSLHKAAGRFRAKDREGCAAAARVAAGGAWQLLQETAPSEAILHTHALSHAMLAASLTDPLEAMRHADLALLLCPDLPIGALHGLAQECNLRCQAQVAQAPKPCAESRAWQIPAELDLRSPKVPQVSQPIERVGCHGLSVMSFRERMLKRACPALVEGHLSQAQWSAQGWSDLRFWAVQHGHRTIPIEMGSSEDDATSMALQQSTVSEGSLLVSEFVEKYLLPSNESCQRAPEEWPSEGIDEWSVSQVAYMAQHQLLMQIPELRCQIYVPHFCSLGQLQTVNVWIGTAGTVTALHYDLDDNFLVQVAGFKYVRLYAFGESDNLYAEDAPRDRGKKHGASFSPVRVESPDLEVHPKFARAQYTETLLGPGEMLFIPKKCWHYVRSLTTSISVNFWF